MQVQIKGPDKVLFGVNSEGESIYMDKPTFDCDWYWSFGYLGNRHCHYHLESYDNGRNINMYDALKQDYTLTSHVEMNLWQVCELALSIYTLKKTADLYHIGGSLMTCNRCKGHIQDIKQYNKIVNETLPQVLQSFWDLVTKGE